MWRPLQLLKKWENSKRGIITGSLGCQNSPICHVKVCYDYISQASPPIDYPTKNCSRQQQGDKFFSLFVYITCYFVIDHLNVIGWLNVDHSVFQKEELWLALIYVCSNCIPFYIIYVSLVAWRNSFQQNVFRNGKFTRNEKCSKLKVQTAGVKAIEGKIQTSLVLLLLNQAGQEFQTWPLERRDGPRHSW